MKPEEPTFTGDKTPPTPGEEEEEKEASEGGRLVGVVGGCLKV